jgi:hypothetical protein
MTGQVNVVWVESNILCRALGLHVQCAIFVRQVNAKRGKGRGHNWNIACTRDICVLDGKYVPIYSPSARTPMWKRTTTLVRTCELFSFLELRQRVAEQQMYPI